jgi:biopolymer transport protein ExbB
MLLPHDLSPWGMFMSAALVVKAVMIGLALASFATWTVWIAKTFELVVARRRARAVLKALLRVQSLSEAAIAAGNGRSDGGGLIRAAMSEVRASPNLPIEGIKERVAISLSSAETRAARKMGLGTGVLATIGSTAPFIGLFGTVWGIMNSFIGISKSQTTNLAVVAPGIAEALLATAFGLAAAIPAVMIFNYFARTTRSYLDLVARASGAVGRLLSRDLDRTRGRAYPRAAE